MTDPEVFLMQRAGLAANLWPVAVLALTTAVRAAIFVSAAIVLWLALVAIVAGYER